MVIAAGSVEVIETAVAASVTTELITAQVATRQKKW